MARDQRCIPVAFGAEQIWKPSVNAGPSAPQPIAGRRIFVFRLPAQSVLKSLVRRITMRPGEKAFCWA
jgi:hypothetical protein